jgi:hypothetical protein
MSKTKTTTEKSVLQDTSGVFDMAEETLRAGKGDVSMAKKSATKIETPEDYDPRICQEKHKSLSLRMTVILWAIGLLATMIASFIGVVLWSAKSADATKVEVKRVEQVTEERVNEVANHMAVHEARQNGSLKSIDQKLEGIEKQQEEYKEEFEKIGDKLDAIRANHDHSSPP